MARLVGRSDGFCDRVIELHLGLNRLGRSPDNDFPIEHLERVTQQGRLAELCAGDIEMQRALEIRDAEHGVQIAHGASPLRSLFEVFRLSKFLNGCVFPLPRSKAARLR